MFFGNYAPDLPDRENEVTVAKNVIPATKSFKPVGTLTAISNALTARCQGAISVSDANGNSYNYAADASDIYLLSSNAFASVNQSKTGTDISFTATTTITSIATDLSVFGAGQVITVSGSTDNNEDFTIGGAAPTSTNITVTASITTEAAGDTVTIKRKYSTASDENWEFVKFGTKLLATNFADPVQSITIGAGNKFANLAGSPPKAKHMAVVGQFVVLGNINDGTHYPYRLHWSSIGAETGWTAGTNQSDTSDLFNGGAIQRILGGEHGIIFCEKSIYKMTYQGYPVIFQIDEIEPDRGTPCPMSVAQLGNGAFYLGMDGFYFFNGAQSQNIGTGLVDKTFYADLDQSYFNRVVGAIDPINTIVLWIYPGAGNSGGTPNKIIAYNYSANRWAGPIEVNTEWLFSGLSEGVTLDGLASLYASLDAIQISLDSRFWQGGSTILSAFDSDHTLGLFTGTAMDATIETGELGLNPGGRAMVSGLRPLVDGDATVTAQIGYRDREGESVTWTSETSPSTQTNLCPFRSNARYHRARIKTSGDFTHIYGFDVDTRSAGKK